MSGQGSRAASYCSYSGHWVTFVKEVTISPVSSATISLSPRSDFTTLQIDFYRVFTWLVWLALSLSICWQNVISNQIITKTEVEKWKWPFKEVKSWVVVGAITIPTKYQNEQNSKPLRPNTQSWAEQWQRVWENFVIASQKCIWNRLGRNIWPTFKFKGAITVQ